MVDVKSQRCKHEGCNKNPSFNFEDEKGRRFCTLHKLNGMVDVSCRNKRSGGIDLDDREAQLERERAEKRRLKDERETKEKRKKGKYRYPV
mmetsp:Transcript_5042/g.7463  ORF Transcript_5042/g.7463 Transcript_5042/m.7463 type:complete len:91 (+) Transcript_5042:3-275(+)